jgi:daunorubicin/doxorubicin transport system ATP-binding protein
MTGLAIEATDVKKSFGAVEVLRSVDLRVERGSVFSLLGPNGAGKTTIVRILSTLTRADAGRAFGWQDPTPPAATWSLRRRYSVLLCTSSQ